MTFPWPQLIAEIYQPDSVDQLAEIVAQAARDACPLYVMGGGTSGTWGGVPTRPGRGVVTTSLARVIDYPAADMTITVESGMTIAQLSQTLATHRQRLPLDVPQPAQATLGGVLATNWSGPLRFGHGTARDYVLGIRAVDGRGERFAGGGRVVKNVAGYDFCKLLIGSEGVLGIITEVTLKVKPLPPAQRWLVFAPRDADQLEAALTGHLVSPAQPVVLDWVGGAAWRELAQQAAWPSVDAPLGWLTILLEGTSLEVDWMERQVLDEWQALGASRERFTRLGESHGSATHVALTQFSQPTSDPLLKFQIRPRSVGPCVTQWRERQVPISWQFHAGNGVGFVRLEDLPAEGLAQSLLRHWQPWATADGGNVIVAAADAALGLTTRVRWGLPSGPIALIQRIAQQFDPQQILNPQRFVMH